MGTIRKIIGTVMMVVGATIIGVALVVGRAHLSTSHDPYFSDPSCTDRSATASLVVGACRWSQARISQATYFQGLTVASEPFYSFRIESAGRMPELISCVRGPARPLFYRVRSGEHDVRVQRYGGEIVLVQDAGGTFETRQYPRDAGANALHVALIGGGVLLVGFFLMTGPIWEIFTRTDYSFD